MKKFPALFVVGILLFSGFGVIAASEFTISEMFAETMNIGRFDVLLSFTDNGDYQIIDEDNGQRIEMDGFGYLMVPGKPLIPSKNVLIALPIGAKVLSIKVEGIGATNLPGIYHIMPVPMIMPIDDSDQDLVERLQEEWHENYKNTYSSDQVYPSEIGQLTGSGTLRKYSYVSVSLYPFSYHPESGLLVHYDAAEVVIDYSIPFSDRSLEIEELKWDTWVDERASSLFINFEQVKELYQPEGLQPETLSQIFDYVVITTEELSSAIVSSAFLDWKTSLGYTVKMVYVTDDEITGQPGNDIAEQIRNFLRSYYMPWGVKYVLLVGDYTAIPMRYCSPNPYWLEGTVPTDTYYADLSLPDEESWDSNDDGYYGVYGEDNPDFLAEVYVGRIPVNDVSRITYTLDKIVAFEQDTGTWKNNALHGGAMLFYKNEDHNPEIDHDMDGCSVLDAIEKDLMNDWYISHYSEHEGLSPSIYDWDALSEPAFTTDWRSGQYAVVNWAAHGAPTSIGRVIWDWDDGDGIPEHDNGELIWGRFLDTYSNLDGDYPSIVFAVSCNVGWPEPTGDGNLGIDLLTKESFGAAVAVCSATRGAAVSVNWTATHAGAEALCYEFNHYMINGPDGPERVGDALYNSKFYVHHNFGWDHYLEYQNMFNYNLYGDPSLIGGGASEFPPSKPVISGSTNGRPGVEYEYTFITEDPGGENVYYYIDWGDDTFEEWLGPYPSSVEVTVNHTWSEKGKYTIKARAKDTNGLLSPWGTLTVTMPKNKPVIQNTKFLQLFERFTNSFPLLEQLFNFQQMVKTTNR